MLTIATAGFLSCRATKITIAEVLETDPLLASVADDSQYSVELSRFMKYQEVGCFHAANLSLFAILLPILLGLQCQCWSP